MMDGLWSVTRRGTLLLRGVDVDHGDDDDACT